MSKSSNIAKVKFFFTHLHVSGRDIWCHVYGATNMILIFFAGWDFMSIMSRAPHTIQGTHLQIATVAVSHQVCTKTHRLHARLVSCFCCSSKWWSSARAKENMSDTVRPQSEWRCRGDADGCFDNCRMGHTRKENKLFRPSVLAYVTSSTVLKRSPSIRHR